MTISGAGAPPPDSLITGVLSDKKVTYAEAERLKQQYGSKKDFVKALVTEGHATEAGATLFADQVFQAAAASKQMKAAGQKDATVIHFVDHQVEYSDGTKRGDGKIGQGETFFETQSPTQQANQVKNDYFLVTHFLLEETDKSNGTQFKSQLEGGKKGNDAYLPPAASQELLQTYDLWHAFGSVEQLQTSLGLTADGKIGTSTISAIHAKGREIAARGGPQNDQERTIVHFAVAIETQKLAIDKKDLRKEAQAIIQANGPKTPEERATVGLAVHAGGGLQEKRSLLGLGETTLKQTYQSASPKDADKLTTDLKARAAFLPAEERGRVLAEIDRARALNMADREDPIPALVEGRLQAKDVQKIDKLFSEYSGKGWSQTRVDAFVKALNESSVTHINQLDPEHTAPWLKNLGIKYEPGVNGAKGKWVTDGSFQAKAAEATKGWPDNLAKFYLMHHRDGWSAKEIKTFETLVNAYLKSHPETNHELFMPAIRLMNDNSVLWSYSASQQGIKLGS